MLVTFLLSAPKHIVEMQVSFAPTRGGWHTGRLVVTAMPVSGSSTRNLHSFTTVVELSAGADTPAVQVG